MENKIRGFNGEEDFPGSFYVIQINEHITDGNGICYTQTESLHHKDSKFRK